MTLLLLERCQQKMQNVFNDKEYGIWKISLTRSKDSTWHRSSFCNSYQGRAFLLVLPHIWLFWRLAHSSEANGWYKQFQHIPECLLRFGVKQRSISQKPRALLSRLRLWYVWSQLFLLIPGPKIPPVST